MSPWKFRRCNAANTQQGAAVTHKQKLAMPNNEHNKMYKSWARSSVVVKALCYKLEGRGFDTRWGDILNLPSPSGHTRAWGLLSLYQKWVPET
jgi:hypothetical protein